MHYLLFYDVVDDYAARRMPLRAAHLAHARAAVARGELVLGGALANPVDGAVLLFRGESPAAAEGFAASDPYVLNGLVTRWRVREWTSVVGADAESPLPDAAQRPSRPWKLWRSPMASVRSSPPPEVAATQHVYQVALGYMASAALQVVLELEIADRLGDGPKTVAQLAQETGTNEETLYRILRTLSSVGIFEEQATRTFGLNLAAAQMRKGPGSFRDMGLWITSPFHFRVYSEMMHSVKTGSPAAEKVVGMSVFEFFGRPENRELSARFNNAMTAFSAAVAPAALKVYDFSDIAVLVDVAGGHGQVLASILCAHPRMRGILFDVDHVIAGAGPVLDAAGVRDRVQTASGDFFKAVPSGGDAYIMKHIIHDWDDERSIAILKNIRAAVGDTPNGRVILLESVLLPPNQPDFGKMIDLEMMMMPGGRERTADEFHELFTRAGFTLTRIEPTDAGLSVIEGRPASTN